MDTQHNLPNNDSDLQLSRAIGKVLEANQSFTDLEDALIAPLLEYKHKELREIQALSVASSLWRGIEAKTKPTSSTKQSRILPLFSQKTIAWASAAVIIIAAFIGIFWLTSQPDLTLVASATNTVTTITLDDGTEVTLRPNTRLLTTSTSRKKSNHRTYFLEGEAFFEVAHDPHSPFSVHTNDGTVTVLGTRFNLSTWGQTTKVYLEEGSVSLSAKTTGQKVILKPGESAHIIEDQLSLPAPANADSFTDWMHNILIFKATSPQEVIAELGQHFGIAIDIHLLEDTSGIDGTLRLDSLPQTLSDLGLVLGGTFRQISENEYQFTPLN